MKMITEIIRKMTEIEKGKAAANYGHLCNLLLYPCYHTGRSVEVR
jgi:hypothetical protein